MNLQGMQHYMSVEPRAEHFSAAELFSSNSPSSPEPADEHLYQSFHCELIRAYLFHRGLSTAFLVSLWDNSAVYGRWHLLLIQTRL